MRSVEERFWSKVDVRREDECWPWNTTSTDRKGYGLIRVNRILNRAPRLAYELAYGSIPKYDPENPIVVRHKCDNPPCCNPAHLELGTHADNTKDMLERGRQRNGNEEKTHCPQGHEYSVENTWISKTGGRYCRECHCNRERERRNKEKSLK